MTEAESEELGSQLRRLSSEKCWLEIHEADLGPDDPTIAESKINLAECYFQQCQYKDAEELYKQVLTQAHAKKFGPINGDNKSIWQVAEDREKNKGINDYERVPYAELGAWLKDAKGSPVTIALGKLKTPYQQQGKVEAVKTLEKIMELADIIV